MPRTLDRNGSTLRGGAIDDDFSRRRIFVRWTLRLAEKGGDLLTPANWTYYELPARAVISRNRSAQLGEGPARLTLTLLADRLPAGFVPKRYMRLEIDRVRGYQTPNCWPYFTGTITAVTPVYAERGGATVLTYQVEAEDELSRCKGRWIDTIAIAPVRGTATSYLMTAIIKEVRGSFSASGPSTTQAIPDAVNTYRISFANWAVFSINSDYSSPLTRTTDYSINIDDGGSPAKRLPAAEIVWTGAGSVPAALTTVYYKIFVVQHFGLRRYRDVAPPALFFCPYGRDHRDTFQTEVSSWDGGTNTITPKDPTPYASTAGLLDPNDGAPYWSAAGAQSEYLSITDSDGTEDIVEIASTNASGQIVLTGAPSFTPAAGDPIRVVTTELFPAWEEFGHRPTGTDRNQIRVFTGADTLSGDITAGATTMSWTGSGVYAGNLVLIGTELIQVTAIGPAVISRGIAGTTAAAHLTGASIFAEVHRSLLTLHPDLGIAIPNSIHFATSTNIDDGLTILASPLLGAESGSSADPNRVEEVVKDVLGDTAGGLALYRAQDIQTFLTSGVSWGPTGAYMKNHVRYQMDAAEFLAEIKDTALPANGYILGERDGKISIRPIFQSATPDLWVNGVQDVEPQESDEPNTAIIVVCEEGRLVNMAPIWFSRPSQDTTGTATMDADIARVIDGNRAASVSTLQSNTNFRGLISFTIPGVSPSEAFPAIKEVRLFGVRGFLTVYATQGSVDVFVPGFTGVNISQAGTNIVIPGDVLARAAANFTTTSNWTLTIQLEADNTEAIFIYPDGTGSATAAELTEIEIMAMQVNVWRAELTSDTDKVGSAYHPTDSLTQFGSIFVQASPGSSAGAGTAAEKISYLWAPPSYLQRVCPDYGATAATTKHRVKIVRLTGVSQFDARTLAEDYLLEETYRATPYRITALLDDRIEIGDTLCVGLPDGSVKNLLCEGYSDGGDLSAELAQYICTDRSATNREMDGQTVERVAYADSAIVGLAVVG